MLLGRFALYVMLECGSIQEIAYDLVECLCIRDVNVMLALWKKIELGTGNILLKETRMKPRYYWITFAMKDKGRALDQV
jgi:hypothetical protein